MEQKWQLTAFLVAALLIHTSVVMAASIPFYCMLDELQCPSNIKQCIQHLELCNGIKDCADGSDENADFCKSYGCNDTHPINPAYRTLGYDLGKQSSKCPSGNMCTKTAVLGGDLFNGRPWLCTGGQKDCADGSDEDPRYCETLALNCSLNAQGLFDEYLSYIVDSCPSKKYCVGKSELCDGKKDCPDGSDEWPSFCKNFTCSFPTSASFRCKDWGCLYSDNDICNGLDDCGDGSDEDPAFCADYKCPRSRGKKCPDGRTCLSDSQICDGIKTCPDGSDEEVSFCLSFKCPGFKYKCKDGKQCIGEVEFDTCSYPSWAGAGASSLSCKDKSDADNALCPSPAPICGESYIRCPSGVGCMSRGLLCDGKEDCKDGSDEGKFCKTYDCRDYDWMDMGDVGYMMCNNTLTCTPGLPCNGFVDCTDGSDEDPAFCRDYKCPQGSHKCKNFPYQCVEDKFLCDGRKHCINGGDEDKEFCRSFNCPAPLQKCPNYPYQCIDPYVLCDGKKDCSDGGDEDQNFCKDFECLGGRQKCPKDAYQCIDSLQLCDGYKNCVNGQDEDPAFCKSHKCTYDSYVKCPWSSTYQCVREIELCDGVEHCHDGSDEDPEFCTTYQCSIGGWKCANSKCIQDSTLCNGADDCGDGSDEDPSVCKSSKCSDSQWRCPNSTSYQCIFDFEVCNGRVQCADGSDEDPAFCTTYVCPADSWKCPKSPLCISKYDLCNGRRDCYDGADEDPAFCTTYICPAYSWKCPKSPLCISEEALCDGRSNCYDNADEDPKMCNNVKFRHSLTEIIEGPEADLSAIIEHATNPDPK